MSRPSTPRTLLESLSERTDRLSDAYRVSAAHLGVIRILFGLYALLAPIDVLWVGQVPEEFFRPPPGPFALLGTVPPVGVLVTLQIAQALLALALVVGYRTATVSVALSVVLVVCDGLAHSFGKVDHFILFEVLPLAMAAAGWGRGLSLDARRAGSSRSTSGFAVLCWAVVVGFAFLTAAVPKALTGWLDPGRLATRGYVALDVANPLKPGLLTYPMFSVDHALLWKFLDYGTVAAEGVLLLLVVVPVLFRWCLVGLCLFHLGVYLTLGIDFSFSLLVYLPFLVPLAIEDGRTVRRRRRRGGEDQSAIAPGSTVSTTTASRDGAGSWRLQDTGAE